MRRTLLAAALVAAVAAIPTSQAATGPAVSLAVSSFKLEHGDSILLSGVVGNSRPDVPVTILARPFTGSAFQRAATVRTGANGVWSYRASPTVATTYQARAGGTPSRMLMVGVQPAISLTLQPNGRIQVRVAPDAFAGRSVRVQRQQDDGSWSTVLKLRLGSRSAATVKATRLPTTAQTLRVALSVNQAGAGYLGSVSEELGYPRRWASLSAAPAELAFGESLTLSGRISVRQAGVPVTIRVRPLAKAEFQPRATVKTVAGGRWSYTVEPWVSAAYQARLGAAQSRVLSIGVRPDVTVQVASGGRVTAKVTAGRSLAGRAVQLQQRQADGSWKTLARQRLDRSSEAVFPASAAPGGRSILRIAMSVNQAGAGYLAGFSREFVYQR